MVKYVPVDKLIDQIITYITEGKVPEGTDIDFNAFLVLPAAGAHRVISNLIRINEPIRARARRTIAGKNYRKLFIVRKIVKRVNRKKLFIVRKYRK